MTIRMILSLDRANTLGYRDGRLAYRLPADMKRFKELTTGGTVVMGIHTFASLNRPAGLPNRKNVVMSHRPYMEVRHHFSQSADIDLISSFDYVLQLNARKPELNFWIIGGAMVFDDALAMGIVDEIYLTLVHSTCDADVTLRTDLAAWKMFILNEAKVGRLWDVIVDEPIWDGEHQTTYITLRKALNA